MKGTILISLILISFCYATYSQIPINHLKLWISADSLDTVSGKVNKWYDKSGNNYDLLQVVDAKRPLFVDSVLGNKPAVRFDGTNDFMKVMFGMTYNQPNTIFVLFNVNSSDYRYIYDGGAGFHSLRYWLNSLQLRVAGSIIGYSLSAPTEFILSTNIFDFTSSQIYENSSLQQAGFLPLGGLDGLTLGSYYDTVGAFHHGDIVELVFYDTILDFTERSFIENYLMDKYAPPVNLGSDLYIDYTFCDTMLNSGEWFQQYQWNTGAPGDTLESLTISQSGLYSVTVTDIFGRISYDSVYVNYPLVNQINDTTICFGDTIYWNTGLNHDYDFAWSTSTTDSILPIYEAGDYFVQVTDSFGCTFYTDTITVKLDSFPVFATLGPDTSVCSGNLISIQNAVGKIFVWSTGETTQYISIDTAGQYWVIVSDSLGCVKRDTVNYSIQGIAPTPLFTSSITCIGDTTFFTDISYPNDNSNIDDWKWNFGDAFTSTEQHPEHLYQTPGSYAITLEVATDSGCVNVLVDSMQVYKTPDAGFEYTALCANNPTYFSDTSITEEGTIIGWEWDFGDFNQSISQNPGHTYANSGYYNIEFVAVTDFGCRDTAHSQLYLKESPLAGFGVSTICVGNQASFADLSSSEPENPLLNWNWNYNNISFSSDQSPKYEFPDTGYYDVVLFVQSVNGCVDSVSKRIFVNASPIALFRDTIACMDNVYEFTDSSSIIIGDIVYWKWIIDGNVTIEEQNPDYIFDSAGLHSVDLIVRSDSSCVDTFGTTDFYVQILPEPDFTFQPPYSIPYGDILFSVPDSPYTYDWNFGDGSSSVLINPVHMYQDSGLYEVQLIVTDTVGCRDSMERQINILIPNCDIVVGSVDYDIEDGYMSVSSVVGNFGNIIVTEMELFIHLDNGYQIKEEWTGQLDLGTTINYNFSGTYKVDQNNIPELICVIATPLEYIDIDETNNEYCLVDQSAYSLLDPYPNPTSDIVYYEVVLPAGGEISVMVYDKKGKMIEHFNETGLKKGYNKQILRVENYAQGTYTLKVKYLENYHSKQFVVKK